MKSPAPTTRATGDMSAPRAVDETGASCMRGRVVDLHIRCTRVSGEARRSGAGSPTRRAGCGGGGHAGGGGELRERAAARASAAARVGGCDLPARGQGRKGGAGSGWAPGGAVFAALAALACSDDVAPGTRVCTEILALQVPRSEIVEVWPGARGATLAYRIDG